jgi:hypothetical protein
MNTSPTFILLPVATILLSLGIIVSGTAPLECRLGDIRGMKHRQKQFVFEKENQKTFAPRVPSDAGARLQTGTNKQKFFASFFQKRSPSFLTFS